MIFIVYGTSTIRIHLLFEYLILDDVIRTSMLTEIIYVHTGFNLFF